ncbi:hypothetical protein BDZ88DRAFT_484324 [Geranomyces variabilis]|nr:hypothetical protein BDZ88DRAFT_484324 [Geranomyces variabilis]
MFGKNLTYINNQINLAGGTLSRLEQGYVYWLVDEARQKKLRTHLSLTFLGFSALVVKRRRHGDKKNPSKIVCSEVWKGSVRQPSLAEDVSIPSVWLSRLASRDSNNLAGGRAMIHRGALAVNAWMSLAIMSSDILGGYSFCGKPHPRDEFLASTDVLPTLPLLFHTPELPRLLRTKHQKPAALEESRAMPNGIMRFERYAQQYLLLDCDGTLAGLSKFASAPSRRGASQPEKDY